MFVLRSLADDKGFSLSDVKWYKVLELARMYGWQPVDLKTGSNHQDEKDYAFSDDIVTERDARALAAALSRALADIPEQATGGGKLLYIIAKPPSQSEIDITVDNLMKGGVGPDESGMDIRLLDEIDWRLSRLPKFFLKPGSVVQNFLLSPTDFFSGSMKRQLRYFVDFCNKGAFSVQ